MSVLAQTTTRASVNSNSNQGDGRSDYASISADGRFVAFESEAANLVPNDTNNTIDIFVRDTLTGETSRQSIDSNGAQLDGISGQPSISSDGLFISFNYRPRVGPQDILVRDRQAGRTLVATSGGNDDSYRSAVSAGGRFVAFSSAASNLVAGDTNGMVDVFVHDFLTGITDRVSVSPFGTESNGDSILGSISEDGRFVGFWSYASNLTLGDANGLRDSFVYDRQTGNTILVSADPAGHSANGASAFASLSSDGRYVAFQSDASNLVGGDNNSHSDVFVRDLQAATTVIVSVDSNGMLGNADSYLPTMSRDGTHVVFASDASNLVVGDTNLTADIFIHDLPSATTSRASISSGGFQGNHGCLTCSISADGRFVAFDSDSTNLVANDTNSVTDVFLNDTSCSGAISNYCTAKINSLGCLPSIGSVGVPAGSGPDGFYVTAAGVLNNKLGMMLWSLTPASNPFGGGILCLQQPITRTPSQPSGGSPTGIDCTGSYAFHFSHAYMIQQLLAGNTTVYAQYWSRDPGFAPPNNIGLTNGLRFTICP
jgi:Tol biopolymer transport system component